MLLDEPFSALDTGLRASTRKAVARLLADAGVTTLLVTHDQEEALSIADQIAVMRDGRFTQVGAPQDVYRQPNDRFTAEFLGDCISLPCTVASGVAECALGRVPVQTSAATGPRRWRFGPNSLLRRLVSDSESRDGVGTVIGIEFLGHDVLLTIDPAGRHRADHRATAQPRPPADRRQGPHQGDRQRGRPEVSGLVDHLHDYGDRVAVLTETTSLTYRELADGSPPSPPNSATTRRLVLLETRNELSTLVHYLGALAGDHVVLPMSAGRSHVGRAALAMTPTSSSTATASANAAPRQRPPVASRPRAADVDLGQHRFAEAGPAVPRQPDRECHGDRRLSAISANTDRAATTLPMSYCYGLSVIHSHLLRGAGLILTDRSVVDDEFWALFRRHRGTSFAGVPYTFEMLERIGFDGIDLPDLRYVTQAGGRLLARTRAQLRRARRAQGLAAVRHVRRDGGHRPNGLPAAGTRAVAPRARSAGRSPVAPSPSSRSTDGPIPTSASWSTTGANVMMGYAHSPADLALGKTVDTLHTGDVARRAPDGLYEVIGRSSRFVKLYGLRIDLQRVEAALSAERRDSLLHRRRRAARGRRGRPRRACRARHYGVGLRPSSGRHPRDHHGRTAAAAVGQTGLSGRAGHRASNRRTGAVARRPARTCSPMSCRSIRARSAPTRASSTSAATRCPMWPCRFGSNGRSADSRSTGSGGRWPNWSSIAPPERRSWPWLGATLETSVALRAAAIVLIVGSHATLYEMWGGAHLLLGIAGYNFGRFCLTPVPRVRPGSPPAQDNCVDRRAVGDMDRARVADHRRLPPDQPAARREVLRTRCTA